MSTLPTERNEPIAVPRPRDEQRPAPFPLAASVAPLLASGVLWAVTQSVFALVFALLSPVVAVAGMLDARRHARRRRRDEEARYDRELHLVHQRLAERHEAERAQLKERTPGAAAVLNSDRVGRWRSDPDRFAVVSLGIGDVASAVRVTGAGLDDDSGLQAAAAVLSAAPVEADAAFGIGVTGPPALARAVARGYLIQLADAFAPDRLAVRLETSAGNADPSAPPDAWAWARVLPHAHDDDSGMVLAVRDLAQPAPESARAALSSRGDTRPGAPGPHAAHAGSATVPRRALLAVARTPQELPPGCRVVIAVDGVTAARVIAGIPEVRSPLVPELVPDSAAACFAIELAERARTAGLARSASRLPARVRFDELEQTAGAGLTCTIGVRASGAFAIDLLGSGPHAVIAGTTGSGKSELLVTWVTAMAAIRGADEVAFLLVDFKGGTTFAPLSRLPHTVGVITDLGHGEALRALQSLQAELLRRERLLSASGLRDVDQATGSIGRLVIVVDEFAAMLDAFPELNPLFTDIAARGRALGVHLVLCTQRATGVVRDALLANCALRVSLRVTGAADSIAVLGTDAAAGLSPARPGRCIVGHDGEFSTVQVAVTEAEQIDAVARRAEQSGRPRPPRPWLDPLPPVVRLSDAERRPGAVAIALCDRPDEQRRHTVFYDPAAEHIFALGMRASGKSSLATTIASQLHGFATVIPDDVERGWDAMERVCRAMRGEPGQGGRDRDASGGHGGDPTMAVLIDDVDSLLERFDGEHRDAMAERLLALLRDGPRRGVSVVCTASRLTQSIRPLLPLLGTTIVLGQINRQEHLLAGAPAHLFEERARPGLGVWHDHRVQLVFEPGGDDPRPSATTDVPPRLDFPPRSTTVLVSRAPGRVAEELRRVHGEHVSVLDVTRELAGEKLGADPAPLAGASSAGDNDPLVLTGDPDAWLAHWQLLTRLGGRSRIVFEGCSVADVRGILRSRILPPPLAPVDGRVWVYNGDGAIERARLW